MRRSQIAAFLLLVPAMVMPATAGAAHFGDALAAYFLQDYEEAHAEWLALAETGHVESHYYLGLLYETGRGVDANAETAISWYRKAAAEGHADAAYRLSRLARESDHLTATPKMIPRWLEVAAEGDVADAQYELGAIFAEGRLVSRDLDKALDWFQRAEENFAEGAKRRQARAMRERVAARLAR